MSDYPLRDALIDEIDRHGAASSEEVVDALLTILVAHVVSERLDPESFLRRIRMLIQSVQLGAS